LEGGGNVTVWTLGTWHFGLRQLVRNSLYDTRLACRAKDKYLLSFSLLSFSLLSFSLLSFSLLSFSLLSFSLLSLA
jgi:hypothetical protein